MIFLYCQKFDEKFSFIPISFKLGSAYLSENSKKTKKKIAKKICQQNLFDFFSFIRPPSEAQAPGWRGGAPGRRGRSPGQGGAGGRPLKRGRLARRGFGGGGRRGPLTGTARDTVTSNPEQFIMLFTNRKRIAYAFQ